MARPNRDLFTPTKWTKVWSGAVGGNTSLVSAVGDIASRVIIVGTLGTLVVVNIDGTSTTWTAGDIIAAGYILYGQFTQVTAAGSTAFDLQVGL